MVEGIEDIGANSWQALQISRGLNKLAFSLYKNNFERQWDGHCSVLDLIKIIVNISIAYTCINYLIGFLTL